MPERRCKVSSFWLLKAHEIGISLTEEDRAKLLKPDYKYLTERSQRTLDFWNKDFKG